MHILTTKSFNKERKVIMSNALIESWNKLIKKGGNAIGTATLIDVVPKKNKYRQTWGKRVIPNAVIDTSMIPVEFEGPCCLS